MAEGNSNICRGDKEHYIKGMREGVNMQSPVAYINKLLVFRFFLPPNSHDK